MKRSLDHLPEGKRRELDHVVEVLRGGFADELATRRAPRFRDGRILKIILFGSYARGDWVEDPIGRYFSDYDILIVVNHEDLADVPEFWLKTDQRLNEELAAGQLLRTPVQFIVDSLDSVNEKLARGRYFFADILREGVLLHAEPGHPFVRPTPLSADQALAETTGYYGEWFESAAGFLDTARYCVSQARLKEAAFQFHQAVERFYHCLFLVRTLYSPKTHNLNRLRTLAEELEPRLTQVWPTTNKFERRCYELLRAAYVKARYSSEYRISAEELAWLDARIASLQDLVREACEARLKELAQAA
ncbi:HEPN domain-containing protein [Sphingomonas histidinilytica]|uniref:Nucleotidyltransferase domain-containing protein n=1 Tax=Rhizorhabdus histidinilytica TaxID=439228 RepID=A0A1T5G304_9SPHN|nr:HEPN domain-containing protein [Rhizorhabdus histidinilytica]MBO9378353.1 HEPN domain-containing protein [Rhizorhabdus histidinilytica]SKC02813.1 Nucleotidyltransferase domain-containing protein [Rhizorhabdus histidinilytica]